MPRRRKLACDRLRLPRRFGVIAGCRGGGEGKSATADHHATRRRPASRPWTPARRSSRRRCPCSQVVLNDPRAITAQATEVEAEGSLGRRARARRGERRRRQRTLDPPAHGEVGVRLRAIAPRRRSETEAAAKRRSIEAASDADLAPYAQLRASQAYARAGKMDLALARAEAAAVARRSWSTRKRWRSARRGWRAAIAPARRRRGGRC